MPPQFQLRPEASAKEQVRACGPSELGKPADVENERPTGMLYFPL